MIFFDALVGEGLFEVMNLIFLKDFHHKGIFHTLQIILKIVLGFSIKL